MLKTLYACFDNELTYLQAHEIAEAKKAGLTDQQIQSFSFPAYNHLQMKEIRLALQNGTDTKKMRCMLRPGLSYEAMHWMRLRLEKGEKVDDIILKKNLVVVFVVLIVLLSLVLYMPPYEAPYLELKQDSVILETGAPFHPMEYIEGYSRGKGQLILPESIDTQKEGEYVLVYKLMSDDTLIEKVLHITICANSE